MKKKGIDSGKLKALQEMYPDKSDGELLSILYPSSRVVPCGKCAACLSKRRSNWVQRLTNELYSSSNGHFITLTFDDDHLVYDIKSRMPVALMSFVSKFIEGLKSKLFRKQKNPLKFFAVSEYGPSTLRPHFHLLLFNLPLDVDLRYLEELWYHGNIVVDQITGPRIGYVTKYCLSKVDPDLWCADDIEYKPSMRCSKNLGHNLLDNDVLVKQYTNSLLKRGYVSNDRFRVPVSRYYRERLLDSYSQQFVSVRSQMYSNLHNWKFAHDKEYYLEQRQKGAALEYNVNKSIKKSEL